MTYLMHYFLFFAIFLGCLFPAIIDFLLDHFDF